MDFDGDGREDIITGSYSPGELYFFKRNEDKTFAKGEKIADKSGKPICIAAASTPFAVDWDADGDLDLLVGDIRGSVHFVENESGDKKTLKFAPSKKMQRIDTTPCSSRYTDISVPGGDSQPIALDHDGDGALDLIVGCGDGSVQFFRTPSRKMFSSILSVLAPTVLVKAPEAVKNRARGSGVEEKSVAAPGMRAKICVCDFNGDGVLDVLLGDFSSAGGGMKKDLTEEEKKKFEDLSKQSREASAKVGAAYTKAFDEELAALGKKRDDLTQEELLEVSKKVYGKLSKDEDYKKASQEYSKIYAELRKYLAPSEHRGNVWYFAGKAAAKPVTGN